MVPVKAIDGQHMRDNFSAHAGDYDLYAEVQKRVVEQLCSRMFNRNVAAGLMLDVGTGTGALAEALSHFRAEPMVMMDIAHGMTREAWGRLPAMHACDGDACSLPFAAESFSLVTSSSVYQWVDCLPSAFEEVFRVLRPGGTFALALFGEKTLYELRNCHCRSVAESGQERSSHVQSFPTRTEVEAALLQSGMVCEELSAGMEVEYHLDVPDLLRKLKQIGAGNASASRPRGLASRKIMQRMIALYEDNYRCSRGVPASYEVIVALARKV